jgi:hypothetical protein
MSSEIREFEHKSLLLNYKQCCKVEGIWAWSWDKTRWKFGINFCLLWALEQFTNFLSSSLIIYKK